MNPIRSWLVVGLNQSGVNNLFNHSRIKRLGESHERICEVQIFPQDGRAVGCVNSLHHAYQECAVA